MLLKLVRLKTSTCIFLQYLKSPKGEREFNQKNLPTLEEKEWALTEGLFIILSVFLDETEAMSAEKYPTFVYALPVLRQVKMHLSIEDMFTTECPDENVKKLLENYGPDTFMPSIISTLETICLGMLDDFKKRFAGMTIDLLWTTVLDPQCHSLKHLSQNETEAARDKLIKELINVSRKEAEVITADKEGHGVKGNTIKGFNIFDSPEKCHHQQQQQIMRRQRKKCFGRNLRLGFRCN
jgi:hypothetical protein